MTSIVDGLCYSMTIGCCVLIYMYYDSLPWNKQTILTYLMQALMFVDILCLLKAICLPLFYTLFKTWIQNWFDTNAHRACNFISFFTPTNTFLICVFFLIVFKTYLRLKPNSYLMLDHEYMFKVITLLIIGIQVIENITAYFIYGTLCRRRKFDYIIYTYGIKVDKSPKFAKNHIVVNFLLVIISSAIHKIVSIWNKCKRRNQVLPIYQQNMNNNSNNSSEKSIKTSIVVLAAIIGIFLVIHMFTYQYKNVSNYLQ